VPGATELAALATRQRFACNLSMTF
jgi:hypothetical protein